MSFQIAGRIGCSGSTVPGVTASVGVGVAIDQDGDVLVYHTESGGGRFGAFAGIGGEFVYNANVENVDGLLGFGFNVGAVAGISPLGGPQVGVEGNWAISTTPPGEDEIIPNLSDEGHSGGVTIAPPSMGKGYGFFIYAEMSYTSEIQRFSGPDALKDGATSLINFIESVLVELDEVQREGLIQSILELQERYEDLQDED